MVKRIDNYGPPSSKRPFGSSEEKSDKKTESSGESPAPVKKIDAQVADEIAVQAADLSGNFRRLDSNIRAKCLTFNFIFSEPKPLKVDDKKVPTKPAFSGPSPIPQRKDSTGHKVESQPIAKPDEKSQPIQVPQPQRSQSTVSVDKPQSG